MRKRLMLRWKAVPVKVANIASPAARNMALWASVVAAAYPFAEVEYLEGRTRKHEGHGLHESKGQSDHHERFIDSSEGDVEGEGRRDPDAYARPRVHPRRAPWPDARRARARAGGGGDPGNGRPDGRGGASGFRPGQGERRTCRPVRHYRHRVGAASWPLLDARASVKGSGRGSRPRAWYEGTCRLRIQRLGGSRDD